MKQQNSTIFPIISKYYWIYFAISLVFLIPGIISLAIWKLRPGIDFSGGTILDFSTKTEQKPDDIKKLLPGGIQVLDLAATSATTYSLHMPALSDAERTSVIATLSATLPGYKETSLSSVGPSIGRELVVKTAAAIGVASIFIAIYLAVRFHSFEYGVSAVVATLHDVLILLGIFSLLGHFAHVDVDSLFVTALLTIVSFSVHDTVVVYDRIRERRKKIVREDLSDTIDAAVLETMTRSVRNSLAVVIVLTSLILLGGVTLRWFAVALLVGTISGTYSSTFVALPLLIVIEKMKKKLQK